MNHKWHYDQLILTRKDKEKIKDVYYEKHHIVPKCHGGSNAKENLVFLTAREHFLAHWLLWKIYGTKEMAFAFHSMKRNKKTKQYEFLTSRHYAAAKEASNFAAKEMHKEGKYKYTEERRQKLKDNPNNTFKDPIKQGELSKRRWNKISKEDRSKIQSEANLKGWAGLDENKRKQRTRNAWSWSSLSKEQRSDKIKRGWETRRLNKLNKEKNDL